MSRTRIALALLLVTLFALSRLIEEKKDALLAMALQPVLQQATLTQSTFRSSPVEQAAQAEVEEQEEEAPVTLCSEKSRAPQPRMRYSYIMVVTAPDPGRSERHSTPLTQPDAVALPTEITIGS